MRRKYEEKEKIQFLIKSLIYRDLQTYIFSFYDFLFFKSLADAKMFKYVYKDFVRRDLAGNFSYVMQAFPGILRNKLTA